MSIKALEDFQLIEKVDNNTIKKYEEILPKELMDVWKEYGFGSFFHGYLKTINPDDFMELVNGTYPIGRDPIPIFTTGMGDIIVIEDMSYLRLLDYRKGLVKRVCKGMKWFFGDLENPNFLEDELDWTPYMEAYKILGRPAYNECYGYVPLLGLGGAEKAENLKKMKLREHIYLITDLLGPIVNVEDV